MAQKNVLALMANNNSLNEILSSIVGLVENFASGCMSTAYFVEDGKLRLGAAPSFPESFAQAVEGCPIGENQGTCGHAAFTGKRAISTDVTQDIVWGPYRDWILSYGIKAAWSTPVVSEDGKVLATLSMCWKEVRVPTVRDIEVVDCAIYLMRIAVAKKKQEELIVEQRLKLVASSRLAALGEMAANLAHEINNPLAIIQGHANLLQVLTLKPELPPADVKQTADQIENTVTRITGIIKGLKAISKDGEHDAFETVSAKALMEETLVFCQDRFKKNGITLNLIFPEQEITFECRKIQISQALLNLINNSFDAIQNRNEKWVNISVNQDKENCSISITDSGPGIPLEHQNKVMDPFFTTKANCNGTGLGLSITKKILESHRGALNLKSDSPHTQFEILLPLRQT
ncbi:MAG: GAF domain-containing sensor histidine kinase [Bdellovibrionales bacterium]|nr:GAF domain-containing sensor histidine kinase [Bdellovibrionales bacterium]